MLSQEAWYNAGNNPTDYWSMSQVLAAGNTREKALTTDTDWQDATLRTGVAYRANISASGGSEKTKFFVSGNFLEEESIFVGNEYLKLNARTNLNHQVNDKLNVGTNLNFTYIDNSPVPVQNGIGRAVNMLPIEPVYNDDGTYFNTQQNPVAWLNFYENNLKNRSLTASW